MRNSKVRYENMLGSADHRAILKFDLVIPLSQVFVFELQVYLRGVQV
jgi:hypothetical protein